MPRSRVVLDVLVVRGVAQNRSDGTKALVVDRSRGQHGSGRIVFH